MEEYHLGGEIVEDLGFCGMWEEIEYLVIPFIADVHGYAITGGFLLSYCCDLVVAAENTKFGDTHAQFGLVPTEGETQRLPRRVGLLKVKDLMLKHRNLRKVKGLGVEGYYVGALPRRIGVG